jgi:hypothetical protein
VTVAKLRTENSVPEADAPWTVEDHLAALYTRISHMRVVDRYLGELPVAALKIFKRLWPEKPVPHPIKAPRWRGPKYNSYSALFVIKTCCTFAIPIQF